MQCKKTDFKFENIKRNYELFTLATDFHVLLKDASNIFNLRSLRLNTLPIHKIVFLYLYNSSVKSYSAIHLLCLEGYGQDSSIILRSLLENLITAKYILYDIKSADYKAKRFEEYRWVEVKNSLEYWEMRDAYQDEKLKKEILSKKKEVMQNVEDFIKKYNIKNKNDLLRWSGISIRKMAEEVSMLEEYLLTYKLCCSFSHPSFIGSLERTKKTLEGINFSSNPSFKGIIEDMKSAILYLYDFLRIYNNVFNLNIEKKLEEIYEKTITTFNIGKYKAGLELNQ